MIIRRLSEADWPQVWSLLEPVFREGETYAYPVDINEQSAHYSWVELPSVTYVAEVDGVVSGTYYLKPNQPGQGAHVCNCGYVVGKHQRGQGIAAAMCQHSLVEARRMGYKAMQFNLVVSTNQDALHVWHKMGFEVVGRLPGAFRHPRLGYVDALVMYQWLDRTRPG